MRWFALAIHEMISMVTARTYVSVVGFNELKSCTVIKSGKRSEALTRSGTACCEINLRKFLTIEISNIIIPITILTQTLFTFVINQGFFTQALLASSFIQVTCTTFDLLDTYVTVIAKWYHISITNIAIATSKYTTKVKL